MTSPLKKRRLSNGDHNNAVPLRLKCAKAKIDTHWKNGTPLQGKKGIKDGKRRETLACLPSRTSSACSDNEEELFIENSSNPNLLTPKVLKHLNTLSDNFTRFFSLLELSFKNDSRDETDTAIIQQTLKDISDDVQKMNEIIDSLCTKTSKQDFKCGSFMSISDRIGGGRMSDKGEFPFHAAIYINSLYKCGGSLISDKIVLTAAHCLVNVITVLRKEVFTVILGLTDLRNLTGHEAIRKVAEVIRHPDYSLSQNIPQNDIGLLVLNGQIQYTSYITHICLFSAQAPIESLIGERGTILGWGLTMDKKISQHLNHAQMTFASRLACTDSNVLFALLNNNAYCANSQGTLQTACSGDSGGGMVLLVNGKFHIRGLVSTAINEKGKICHVGQYVAFTDVSAYLKWIWDNTEIVPDLDERISERKSQTNES
ncbi:unnamed protein product [Diamesa hyperborea]